MDKYHHLKHEKPILSQIDKRKVGTTIAFFYEKYWLKQIGASRLVYQNEKRTNHDLESFHSNLKKRFRLLNHFWEFVKNLNKIITSNGKDLERIDNNVAIRHNP